MSQLRKDQHAQKGMGQRKMHAPFPNAGLASHFPLTAIACSTTMLGDIGTRLMRHAYIEATAAQKSDRTFILGRWFQGLEVNHVAGAVQQSLDADCALSCWRTMCVRCGNRLRAWILGLPMPVGYSPNEERQMALVFTAFLEKRTEPLRSQWNGAGAQTSKQSVAPVGMDGGRNVT